MTRLLLALCLCLALAPAALANVDDAPPEEPAACPAELDGCDQPGGDDAEQRPGGEQPERCRPDGDDEPAGEDGQEDADEPAGDDAADEPDSDAESADDEVGDPQAEAETALPAPGFRDFCEAPVFDRGFLRRNWRVGGDATGFSDGVLGMTVTSIPRVPARFREQAGRLEGLQLAVVVSRRTQLSRTRTRTARGAGRRGSRRVSPGTLERARRVKVEGKLLPPSRWRRDADGLRVPTVRASRVTVVR